MKEEEFNILKTEAKEQFEHVANAIDAISFEDAKQPYVVQRFLRLYDQAVKTGASFIDYALLYQDEL